MNDPTRHGPKARRISINISCFFENLYWTYFWATFWDQLATPAGIRTASKITPIPQKGDPTIKVFPARTVLEPTWHPKAIQNDPSTPGLHFS